MEATGSAITVTTSHISLYGEVRWCNGCCLQQKAYLAIRG
jgi:hypothetical protein